MGKYAPPSNWRIIKNVARGVLGRKSFDNSKLDVFGFWPVFAILDKTHPFHECGQQHDRLYAAQKRDRKTVDAILNGCMYRKAQRVEDLQDRADLHELRRWAMKWIRRLGWIPWKITERKKRGPKPPTP